MSWLFLLTGALAGSAITNLVWTRVFHRHAEIQRLARARIKDSYERELHELRLRSDGVCERLRGYGGEQ